MHLVHVLRRVLFQPDEFDKSLRQDPQLRRRLWHLHILLVFGWIVLYAAGAPLVLHAANSYELFNQTWLESALQYGLYCVVALVLCLIIVLTVGALRQRDYVFSWIVGVWYGILVSCIVAVFNALEIKAAGWLFMVIVAFCLLISAIIGRTRGGGYAAALAAAISGLLTATANSSGLFFTDLRVEHPSAGSTLISFLGYRPAVDLRSGIPDLSSQRQVVHLRLPGHGDSGEYTAKDTVLPEDTMTTVTTDTVVTPSPDTLGAPTSSEARRVNRGDQFLRRITYSHYESDSMEVLFTSFQDSPRRSSGSVHVTLRRTGKSGCLFRLPGRWFLPPVAIGERVFAATEQGFAFLDCERKPTTIHTPKWYVGSENWRPYYFAGSRSEWMAVADGDRIYAISPSNWVFSARHDTLLFASGVAAHRWRDARRVAITQYFASFLLILLVPALCGLYRLPIYILESLAQSGAWTWMRAKWTLAPRGRDAARASPQSAYAYLPVVYDHVSTLPLVGSRSILRKIARDDPATFSQLLVGLLETSKQERLVAREFFRFHRHNREFLVRAVVELLVREEASCLRRLLRHLPPSDLLARALTSFADLYERPTDPTALLTHSQVMGELAHEGYAYAEELRYAADAFGAFLEYPSLDSVRSGERQVTPLLHIGYDDRLLPAVCDFFEALLEVTRDLGNYAIVEKFRDRQYYLSEARIKLYEISRRAKETLSDPYRTLGLQVGEHWLRLITREAKSMRGPAELHLTLETRTLTTDRRWQPVVVSVRNSGQSPAENIRVVVVPSEHFLVQEAEQSLPVLGIDESRDLEFQIQTTDGTDQRLRLYLDAVYDDFERSGKVTPFADIVQVSRQTGEFRLVPNPYIVGIPIQNDRVFFGRKSALDFAVQNLTGGEQNNAIIFFGQRRVGKSSLLYRLMHTELSEQFVFVYIDCQGFADGRTPQVLFTLCRKIQQAAQSRGIALPEPELARFQSDTFLELDRYFDAAEQAFGSMRAVLMFDEYEFLEYKVRNGSLTAEIFNKLRNLMQHRSHWLAFIFAGTHRLTELSRDYWSFLFNTALYYEIGPLARENAEALIRQPIKGYLTYDALAVDKILRATGLHPYFIQVTCRMVVSHCNSEQKNYVTLADVNEMLTAAVEGSTAHVRYLFDEYATGRERDALILLARATDDVKQTASLPELVQIGHESQFDLDQFELGELLSSLAAKKMVRTSGERRGELYAFELDFVRLWIREHVKVGAGGYRLI